MIRKIKVSIDNIFNCWPVELEKNVLYLLSLIIPSGLQMFFTIFHYLNFRNSNK